MPRKQGRDKKPMQRLLPEERGEHGEPAGYVYDLESRVHACQRMSLNVSKITCRLNRAESWSLGNRRRIIEQEEGWREGKLRVATDRHRELLRDYAAYRMALQLAAAKRQPRESGAGPSGGSGSHGGHASSSLFGRYGPDRNYRKLVPLIDAIKKTAFSPEVLRRQQAQALLQNRREMPEVDRRLTTSAVLTFHRHTAAVRGTDKEAAAKEQGRRNLTVGCSLPPIAEGSAEQEPATAAALLQPRPPPLHRQIESTQVAPTHLPRMFAAAAAVQSPT